MNNKYIYIAIVIVLLVLFTFWYRKSPKGTARTDGVFLIGHKIYPKFLKISLDTSGNARDDFFLSLMDVQIFDANNNNIALNASVTTSGNYHEKYPSSNLVDGNLNTPAVVARSNNPWMKITLPETSDITKIVIHNNQPGIGITQPGKDFVGANIQLLAEDNSPMREWTIREYQRSKYEIIV